MKAIIYDGTRKIKVDTTNDECLYAAPRQNKKSSEMPQWTKDLYLHVDPEKKNTYHLHLWSTDKATKDKFMPISSPTAERFLMSKGIICNLFPKSDPIAKLYAMGDGMAEEF